MNLLYFSLKARQAQPEPAQAHEFGPGSLSYEAQAPGFDPQAITPCSSRCSNNIWISLYS